MLLYDYDGWRTLNLIKRKPKDIVPGKKKKRENSLIFGNRKKKRVRKSMDPFRGLETCAWYTTTGTVYSGFRPARMQRRDCHGCWSTWPFSLCFRADRGKRDLRHASGELEGARSRCETFPFIRECPCRSLAHVDRDCCLTSGHLLLLGYYFLLLFVRVRLALPSFFRRVFQIGNSFKVVVLHVFSLARKSHNFTRYVCRRLV